MEKFNFEKALNQLEQIIEKMENDELSLDQSIDHFEKGSKLIKQCNQKLNEAEKKIQILLKDEENKQILTNFEPPSTTEKTTPISNDSQNNNSSLF